MAGIFKAYDIRGIYGDTLDDQTANAIGRAFVTFLGCRKVVIGRDMRPHSKPLFQALAAGITMQGADVIDLGLCSTPISYFGNGTLQGDAGIMVTASHNPGEWNGFKLSRAGAVPISGDTGIAEIERIVQSGAFAPVAPTPGSITRQDLTEAYCRQIRQHARLEKPIRIAADMANAMGIVEAEVLRPIMSVDPLFDTFDGDFPNHEANPLKIETLAALQNRIRGGGYDFGIAFDGDADRVGFVDEQGHPIAMDMMTALIAQDLLQQEKGVIFYDLRSSWSVKEVIESGGGIPMRSRVGHAFIKEQMRKHNAIFAGELSGHYYFRDNFFTESASLAVICVANIVSRSGKPLSELIAPLNRYSASGEINSEVADPAAVLERIRAAYGDKGSLLELDGISVEFDDWWFNVRMSNTEPLVRLNLEAKSAATMTARRDELLSLIRG